MKRLLTLALVILLVVLLPACSKKETVNLPLTIDERPHSEFIGKRFAVLDGTGYETIVDSVFKSKDYIIFESNDDGVALLKNGAVDALIGDYTAAIPWISEIGPETFGLSVVPAELASFDYAAMAKNTANAEEFNAFLAGIKADGTLDDMSKRWVDEYDKNNIPKISDVFTPKNGTANGEIIVGINYECAPFDMPDKDGNPTGFEVELMTRFADSLGKAVNFEVVSFSDMMPYYTSGQPDYITAMCYEISDSEASGIIFTDTYYEALLAVIYVK
ncbi:MAG: transporter substrate-binding domain-containing protein [Ruminococcus sp.]|jgi:polar amino acid transport system substrate-binding protein|nr:transporter substrate-binding domain-containing protein [Ruminococcus sp.]